MAYLIYTAGLPAFWAEKLKTSNLAALTSILVLLYIEFARINATLLKPY